MDQTSLLLIISCAGIFQSLFLAVYLFSAERIQKVERILLGLLLIAITIRLFKSIGWFFYDMEGQLFLNLGFAAHGFIGPILLLYFAEKLNRLKQISHKALIILPAFFFLVASPFLSLDGFWYRGGYLALLYFTIIYLGVAAVFLRIIYNERKIYFPWYRNLYAGVFIFCVSYFTNYTLGLNSYITGPVLYTPIIYFISFVLFRNREIFTPIGDKKKYKNINLSKEQVSQHLDRIHSVMGEQKPFLQRDFNLGSLSELTAIPKHLLSRYFSENLRQSFTDYTNAYRIEKAKELLQSPSFKHHKIAVIAYECGFNSISSFNAAFRKVTSVSPSAYKTLQSQKPTVV
ncbi:MAG: AraC family transcriptional regulator [Cytophagales bacterium]|nr:AraC family transcriptional regulator [Cytophagales bacterium]